MQVIDYRHACVLAAPKFITFMGKVEVAEIAVFKRLRILYAPAMTWRWFQDRRTPERWAKMQKRGRLLNLVLNLLIWFGCYAFVRLVHVACFKAGWLATPGFSSWADMFFSAVIPAFIGAEIDWSDMRRNFAQDRGYSGSTQRSSRHDVPPEA